MRYVIAFSLLIVLSCKHIKPRLQVENNTSTIKILDSLQVVKYLKTITASQLKTNLYKFASKEFEGRKVGELGEKKAANFIKAFYKKKNILPAINDSLYFQKISENFLPKDIKTSQNVVAYIKGKEKPEEVLIISAHMDHEGVKNDNIYFGADDNASGTVAILQIAQAFKQAEKEGFSPKRSILFIHLTAEEIGLYGSKYYTKNPIFNLNKTIANLNIDMIGRIDDAHANNPNYLYIIGADRISKTLNEISIQANKAFVNLNLDYKYNDENDSNRYYYRSDHYNFAKQNIPVIFYFNGTHNDYHQPSDTPDKIDYNLLEKRTKLIFATAWQLANRDKMLPYNQ